ncbi:nitrilase 1 [Heterostelium album PN500]|uniref:Nitrilase 1 n=1 Tax=Heterostelium pallidum (strain ATCC 26659 / Pp 5 / PN500) TaxID=670386 RepID=D3BSH6_HETP5|nr:nitrilase 1 [Heterostelium album PN500]EFA75682.1 nitrilase 1 [Heterostelium album PN500]|eukprot:XP_020427816.1 nitrilase 1 [Heterostelium album PN500]
MTKSTIRKDKLFYSNSYSTKMNDPTANSLLRVAVGQLTSVNSKEKNFEVCKSLVEAAVEKQAKILCLPENFAFCSGGVHQFESRDNAELINGETISKYRALAAQNKIWLSLGGFHEKIENDPEHIYNTHLIIDDNGEIRQTYHKMHLFDVDIPSKGVKMKESTVVLPGDQIATCDSPVGVLGLSICYDLRFPELYSSLRKLGAQILLVPSAFMKRTGEAHWHILLRARAIENQCYVIAAAQTGQHHSKRDSYGHSIIISPWGDIVAELSNNETGIITADIDTSLIDTTRQNMPVFEHRKTQLYKI